MKTNIDTTTHNANPFLQPYQTPHNTIPFDKIKHEHFKTALLEGMAQEDKEIENIVSNPAAPTFENTILALENSGDTLNRVETVLGNLLTACTDDFLENLAQE
ncbi:MAG: peptidase M3, partial [Bacteroidaceae bacterium]